MENEIEWLGDNYETSLFYSTMPFLQSVRTNHVLNWVKDELWDYIIEQPYYPIDHWAFNKSEYFANSALGAFPLSNVNYPQASFYFKSAIGYHSMICSHEFVSLRGLYPPHSAPFIVDGVGYAGTVSGV